MLNNLTNFFNLIVGRRIKTQLESSDLIAVGTKQSPALGDYKPTAIKFEDLALQLGGRAYNLLSGIDPFSFSNLDKLTNYNVAFNGVDYDVYKLTAVVIMPGGTNVYSVFPGSITTSSTVFSIISNSSVVVAADQAFGGDVATAFGTGALVEDEAVLTTAPIDFLFLNYDNNVTTPDEYFIFVVGATSFNFNCRITIDVDIVIEKGATVEYNIL